ncbi:transcriptional attenuator, LytR family [Oceanobacillus limi]|uniref:Transcriptional attenuator, LytR family n=1 Tax=Oceanobacillus limi TaxID=930131 RepID=A0A1I0AH45_9BACI|nr:LCP family protein [Oceanobacillus limi]SES93148.1 transcriptional attenuator, LytR family [Oceanobacillus limi]
MTRMERRRKRAKRKALTIISLLFLGVMSWMMIFSNTNNTTQSIDADSKSEKVSEKLLQQTEKINPFASQETEENKNYTDEEEEEKKTKVLVLTNDNVSDTNQGVVLSLGEETNHVELMELSNLDLGDVMDSGNETKIDAIMSHIENSLGITLDHFIQMDTSILPDIVDALGGITVTNQIEWVDEGFYQEGYRYAKGKLELDGDKTRGYLFMQDQDPNGEIGQMNRQMQVTEAIMEKLTSSFSIGTATNLWSVMHNNVETSLNLPEMIDILMAYGKMDSLPVSGEE